MGSITAEFTCVEFGIDVNYDIEYEQALAQADKKFGTLEVALKECEFKDCFNLVTGTNGGLYFTAAPCGSKDGWEARRKYGYELTLMLSLIKAVSDYYTEKRVITSAG